MTEEIELRITGDGTDAERAVDDVANALDDLPAESTVDVDADVRDALSNIEKLERDLDGVTDDTAELRIRFRGEQLQRDIGRSLRQLERLDDPIDIRVKTDEIEAAQSELRELSDLADRRYDVEISADPKNLARAGAEMDGVASAAQSGIGPLRGFTDELGGGAAAAGQSAAALIDAGEAAQIFGAQLGISDAKLGKFAGAMTGAAVGLAAAQLAWGKLTAAAKAEEAFDDEQVETFTEALTEAKNAIDAVEQVLTDTGKIEVQIFEGFLDANKLFNALGVGVEEVSELIAGSADEIDAWGDALIAAGESSDDVAIAVKALKDNQENLNRAQDEGAASAEFLAGKTADVGTASYQAGYVIDQVARRGARQWREMAAAADDAEESIDEVTSAYDILRGRLDDRQAVLNLQDAFEDLETKATEAMQAAADGTADATEKLRDYEKAQIDTSNRLIDWAENVSNLPAEVVTQLVAEIDEGSLANAQATLRALETPLSVPLDVVTNIVNTTGAPIPGGLVVSPPAAATPAEDPAFFYRGQTAARGNTTVIVNAPPELASRTVADTVARWDRLNGRGRV